LNWAIGRSAPRPNVVDGWSDLATSKVTGGSYPRSAWDHPATMVFMLAFAQSTPVVINESGGWWSATALTAYGTLALALVTVWLARAATRSTGHTKRALDIAQQEADTARQQARTAEEIRRAWLVPSVSLSAQPTTSAIDGALLVNAAVHSNGPGWARIDRAHLELPSGGRVALNPGIGMTAPNSDEGFSVVLPSDHALAEEVATTEFPTLVAHCTNIHGEQGETYKWERGVSEWRLTRQADDRAISDGA
jgi:hypothetical protein